MGRAGLSLFRAVFGKELRDALRDRRTLAVVLLGSVAMGPLVLVLLSQLVAGMERQAEARQVVVHGLEHAPSLRNHFERQTFEVRPAPQGWRQLLLDNRLADPVVVVAPDFEAELQAARSPLVEVVSNSANRRAQAGVGRTLALLRAFNQEQAGLRLALRGVSPALLAPVTVGERDLADPAVRAAQLAAMVPFFVLMAVLYGALPAALDTTAGERERGSLEPLLLCAVPRSTLVLGKWAAVASVGMGVAALSCLSFLPGQWLLRGDTLSALFRFGPLEAVQFIALLLPLAATAAALLMAVALRCRSVKEAQASATVVVLLASLLPLVSLFGQEGEAPWHLAVPALAQVTLMTRVLKGGAIGAADMATPLAVSALLTIAALAYVARRLRTRPG